MIFYIQKMIVGAMEMITGGYYNSGICRKINELYEEGKTVLKIQEVSRATVQSYLPYKKGIYNAKDLSPNVERIRMYICIHQFMHQTLRVKIGEMFDVKKHNSTHSLIRKYDIMRCVEKRCIFAKKTEIL